MPISKHIQQALPQLKRLMRIISTLLVATSLVGCYNIKSLSDDTNAVANSKVDRSFILVEPEEDPLTQAELAALPTPLPEDIWARIRNGYKLDRTITPRVRQQLNWYAKHPAYMNRVAKRGERYMFYIVEQIDKRGLPMELALLPIVESAFDPFAYSHGRASGIWQFIPGTGKMLGLKQNWWYDGRRDVVASTDAALKYLQILNKRFDGDWLHALASYNSGSGHVSKAIRKNKRKGKPTDFWNLKLPRETEAYVPKLIALAILIGEPEKYNLDLHSIPNKSYFAEVDTEAQIDLAQAAELADIEMDTLYQLNPAFNRWATDPQGPHKLLVPTASKDKFISNLSKIPKNQRVTWERYTIRSGDSLSSIASKYKISVRSLKSINQIRGSFIKAGKTLMVPVAAADVKHYSQSLEQRLYNRQNQSARTAKGTRVDHYVKKGESLWTISRRYKVSTRQIAKWNNMAPKDPIYAGQKLAIWTNISQLASVNPKGNVVIRKVSYRVRSGDSLHRIADKFQINVKDILRWNSLNSSKYLQPGQSLTLFVDVTSVN